MSHLAWPCAHPCMLRLAGNHKSGVSLYEDRVRDAARVLRLLKYDGRFPSQYPLPPSPIRTDLEQAAWEATEMAEVEAAVVVARARATSPPRHVPMAESLVGSYAHQEAALSRRVIHTSPQKSTRTALPLKGVKKEPTSSRPTSPQHSRRPTANSSRLASSSRSSGTGPASSERSAGSSSRSGTGGRWNPSSSKRSTGGNKSPGGPSSPKGSLSSGKPRHTSMSKQAKSPKSPEPQPKKLEFGGGAATAG